MHHIPPIEPTSHIGLASCDGRYNGSVSITVNLILYAKYSNYDQYAYVCIKMWGYKYLIALYLGFSISSWFSLVLGSANKSCPIVRSLLP